MCAPTLATWVGRLTGRIIATITTTFAWTRCNAEACHECTDPLLLSIRRSGAREGDPSLPFDEWERELPHSLPFGTQDPRYFASAEIFDVVRFFGSKYGGNEILFLITALDLSFGQIPFVIE